MSPSQKDQPSIISAHSALIFIACNWLSLGLLSHYPPVNAVYFITLLTFTWLSFAYILNTRSTDFTHWYWVAIGARVIGLFALPVYEDDWARYLWDGYRLLQDGSPYGVPPADFFSSPDISEQWLAVLDQINHPFVATIYGPMMEYMFALSTMIFPASLVGLKLLLIAFDVMAWWCISRMGGQRAGLIYALCPLVIFEVAFNAHADIIGVALLTLSAWQMLQNRAFKSGLVFGLAMACKPFAIILLPWLLLRGKQTLVLGAVITLTAVYLPFVYQGATESHGLKAFSTSWEFNSLGFAVLTQFLNQHDARFIAPLLGVALLLVLLYQWWRHQNKFTPPADLWLLALLVFAPVINPWYLLWALPWCCLRPNAVTWAVAPALTISYLTYGALGISGGAHNHANWVRPLEVICMIILCLILQRYFNKATTFQHHNRHS